MKNKKVIALITTIIMTTTMFVGCGGKNEENTGGTTPENSGSKKVSIGLVTDEGGINDKSFNQTANEGVNRARKDLDITYTYVESQKKEDYEPNMQSVVDNGADLTFGIGYQLADAIKAVAKNNPDVNFCLIDTAVEGDNVKSITFKEEEGSFLMGVIAGLVTKTNKVGFIGGKDTETILKFESGFAAGVKQVNPEAAAGLISSDGKTAGSTVKYADSFADTNKGYELAKSLYESGCDVIYHAAGGVGIGMFQAAKEVKDGGKEVWAIGVDMDQSKSLPDYADVILSSMMKRVDNATYDVVKEMVEGKFKAGSVVLGIADGGVGMSDTTSENTPQDVIEKAHQYESQIKEGKIVVPYDRQGVLDFVVK